MSQTALVVAVFALTTGAVAQPLAAQPPTPMPTRDFVAAAAQADQYEILAGRVAVTESQNPQVRAFAQQMIRDHTATSHALQQATLRSGAAPAPMGLSDDGQKFLSQLQSLSGPDFDRAYIRQQVLAHQQALVVDQGYATGGSDPGVKRAARSTIPVIEAHLKMAKQMSLAMTGS